MASANSYYSFSISAQALRFNDRPYRRLGTDGEKDMYVVVIVGAAHEAALWRSLASHIHGRQTERKGGREELNRTNVTNFCKLQDPIIRELQSKSFPSVAAMRRLFNENVDLNLSRA